MESPYRAMPPGLRELHDDKRSRISELSLDVASCVLGRMLGAWFGATEAHVAAWVQGSAPSNANCIKWDIRFDDADDGIVLDGVRSAALYTRGQSCHSAELACTIRADFVPIGMCKSARFVESPYWTGPISSGGLYHIFFKARTRLSELVPVSAQMGVVSAATDGNEVYAVSVYNDQRRGDYWTTAVCTPTAAFTVDLVDRRAIETLAFNPRDGSLLVLTFDRPHTGAWRMYVVRPGPAPQ
jgi:hypothetical protein